MGVFTQPRIKPDVHRQGKIPERIHPESLAQVYRDGDFHRPGFLACTALSQLSLLNSLRQHRGQERRHGHALFMRFFLQLVRRYNPCDDMPEPVRLRRSAQAVGRILRPAQTPGCAAGLEAVPCFLRFRFIADVNNMSFRRDLRTVFQRQVTGRQVFEQDQSARSVGHGMEHFHGDPVVVIQKAYTAGSQFPACHMRQGISEILLGFRCLQDGFQVIPEKASPQAYKVGRKPGFQISDCLVQHLRIHRFLQRGGNPENIVPVFPDNRRKYQSGIVQPVPLFLHLFSLPPATQTVSASMYQTIIALRLFPVKPTKRNTI